MSKVNVIESLKKGYRITIERKLFASEVLEKTLEELAEEYPNRQIVFSDKVFTVVAEDSDCHRTRRDYMGYGSLRVFQFNGRHWALGLGEAWGSYPARPYKSDIIAIEILPDESVSAEKIAERIQLGFGFSDSLIIARANGTLTVERNTVFPAERDSFFYKMQERLEKVVPKFIAQKTKTSDKCISASDSQPVVTQPQCYKPELVKALAEIIPKILGK